MATLEKIEYLTDGHGQPSSEKCDKCGRMVTWLATMSDGRLLGVECAKTECLPEEMKEVKRKMKLIKEYWDFPSILNKIDNKTKLDIFREAKDKDRHWALAEEDKLLSKLKFRALSIHGRNEI